MDLVERTKRISVFSADVEAAEGFLARGAWVMWQVGCGVGALLLGGVIFSRPHPAVLVAGLTVTGAGGLFGGVGGWWAARLVVASVLSKGGVVAA